jgi:hypothetical protein
MPDPIQQYEDADGNIVGSVYGADDGAFVIEDDSGTAVRLTADGITNAAGDPIAGGGGGSGGVKTPYQWEVVDSVTDVSLSSSVSFNVSGYDTYRLHVHPVIVTSGSGEVGVQINGDSGSTYKEYRQAGNTSYSALRIGPTTGFSGLTRGYVQMPGSWPDSRMELRADLATTESGEYLPLHGYYEPGSSGTVSSIDIYTNASDATLTATVFGGTE